MKKFLITAICFVCCGIASAQTNTGNLKITLHKDQLTGFCNLGNDSTGVYMHSGAGYTSSTAAWEAIVGNWGIRDGIGQMTMVDANTYTICINLKNYYMGAKPDSLHGGEGLGPLPANGTVYNIGCVFREAGPCQLNSQGKPQCIEGKDPNCKDIFITNLPLDQSLGGVISVTDQIGDDFPAVTAEYVAACGTTGVSHDISSQLLKEIKAYPNPFSGSLNVEFNMIPGVTEVRAQIYDVMGRNIADFSPALRGGYNAFTWDGTGHDGQPIEKGIYIVKVTNGTDIQTKTIIKQ
jgi:hypothetical protein